MSDITPPESNWSSDIELILENIRKNCVILSNEHRRQYFYLKSYLKYFRLPTIFLSAVNSVASVGLVNYVKQEHVSLITCLISLTTGIITSIELYLGLEKSMNNELEKNRDFYLLGIDIYKTLQLKRENRSVDGSTYLEQCISTYSKLYENSNVLAKNIKDKLTVIDLTLETSHPPISSHPHLSTPVKKDTSSCSLQNLIPLNQKKSLPETQFLNEEVNFYEQDHDQEVIV